MRITCPHCSHDFRTPSGDPGDEVECPDCGELVDVVGPTEGPRPKRRKRPNRKPARRVPMLVWAAVAGGALAVLVIGVVVLLVVIKPPERQGTGGGTPGPSGSPSVNGPASPPPEGYVLVSDPEGRYRVFLPGRPHKITVTGTAAGESRSGYRSQEFSHEPEVVAWSIRAAGVPRADATPEDLVAWYRIRDSKPINRLETVGLGTAKVGRHAGVEWRGRETPTRNGIPPPELISYRVVYLVSDGTRVYSLTVTTQGAEPDPQLLKTVRDSFDTL